MVWPQADGLKVNGADFVIDPYSQGALYLTAEVTNQSSNSVSCSVSKAALGEAWSHDDCLCSNQWLLFLFCLHHMLMCHFSL